MRGFMLAVVMVAGFASGCGPTNQAALAADEAKAKVIMADIAADAAPVGECALQVAATVAVAITTGNYAALLGDVGCIANAVALIKAQVDAGKASPPPLAHLQTVQTMHAVVKAASAK